MPHTEFVVGCVVGALLLGGALVVAVIGLWLRALLSGDWTIPR